jgi:hypothetical protein
MARHFLIAAIVLSFIVPAVVIAQDAGTKQIAARTGSDKGSGLVFWADKGSGLVFCTH